jgi:hypothetical protein
MGLVECSVQVVPWSRRYATVLRMLGPKKTIEYITQSKKNSRTSFERWSCG